MVVSALCSRQLSAFHAYLVYLVCKIHRPDHGSGYSHLLELLRIQKHKISPVIFKGQLRLEMQAHGFEQHTRGGNRRAKSC